MEGEVEVEGKGVAGMKNGKGWRLTSNKHILIRRPHKLDRLLRKQRHVLIDRIIGDILIRGIIQRDQNIQQNDHHHKRKDIIQDNAERRGEVLKAVEISATGITACSIDCMMKLVMRVLLSTWSMPMKACRKPTMTMDEQREEDERFFHHDFQHDEHGAEEAGRCRGRGAGRIQNIGAEKARKL